MLCAGGIQLQLHDRFHVDWYFIDAYSGRWVQGDGVGGQVVHFSTHTQIAQLIYHKVPTHTPSQVKAYKFSKGTLMKNLHMSKPTHPCPK